MALRGDRSQCIRHLKLNLNPHFNKSWSEEPKSNLRSEIIKTAYAYLEHTYTVYTYQPDLMIIQHKYKVLETQDLDEANAQLATIK